MVILIVDDIEINRKLLKVGLEAEGYSTLLAEDGMEALKVLEKEKVDLIISDILMPNMDGYLLCHEVRTSERLRNIPFIIYSSTYTSPGDIKLGEKLGADKFFNRPAPIKEILSAIQELTQRPYSFRPDILNVKDEYFVMKEYNQLVVEKLEEQNKRLDITTKQLEAANQELEAFCYSVSHDLKAL